MARRGSADSDGAGRCEARKELRSVAMREDVRSEAGAVNAAVSGDAGRLGAIVTELKTTLTAHKNGK